MTRPPHLSSPLDTDIRHSQKGAKKPDIATWSVEIGKVASKVATQESRPRAEMRLRTCLEGQETLEKLGDWISLYGIDQGRVLRFAGALPRHSQNDHADIGGHYHHIRTMIVARILCSDHFYTYSYLGVLCI